MLRILVVALVLLVAALFMLPRPAAIAPLERATLLPEPRALPEVALVDQTGAPFDWSRLDGRFALVFFGFTHCPDICPLTLQTLATVRAKLAAERADATPAIVFVSVDPGRDTPERIAAYVRGFDPALIGVIASDAALAPLLAALGVVVEKHSHDGEDYNVVHNGTVYVLGPRAELIGVASPPHFAAMLSADFLKLREHYRRTVARGS